MRRKRQNDMAKGRIAKEMGTMPFPKNRSSDKNIDFKEAVFCDIGGGNGGRSRGKMLLR